MTNRTRSRGALLAAVLGLLLPSSGCFGTSNDKGDNGGSLITPKPGKIEDANTAGDRKQALPSVESPPDPTKK